MDNYHKHDMQTSPEICDALQKTFNRPETYFEVCSTCGEVRMEVGKLISGNNPLHGETTEAEFEEPAKLKALREEENIKPELFLPMSRKSSSPDKRARSLPPHEHQRIPQKNG